MSGPTSTPMPATRWQMAQFFLKISRPLLRVALERQGRLISGQHLLPIGRQIVGEQLLGPFADAGVLVIRQLLGAQRIEFAGFQPFRFDLVEQHIDAPGCRSIASKISRRTLGAAPGHSFIKNAGTSLSCCVARARRAAMRSSADASSLTSGTRACLAVGQGAWLRMRKQSNRSVERLFRCRERAL